MKLDWSESLFQELSTAKQGWAAWLPDHTVVLLSLTKDRRTGDLRWRAWRWEPRGGAVDLGLLEFNYINNAKEEAEAWAARAFPLYALGASAEPKKNPPKLKWRTPGLGGSDVSSAHILDLPDGTHLVLIPTREERTGWRPHWYLNASTPKGNRVVVRGAPAFPLADLEGAKRWTEGYAAERFPLWALSQAEENPIPLLQQSLLDWKTLNLPWVGPKVYWAPVPRHKKGYALVQSEHGGWEALFLHKGHVTTRGTGRPAGGPAYDVTIGLARQIGGALGLVEKDFAERYPLLALSRAKGNPRPNPQVPERLYPGASTESVGRVVKFLQTAFHPDMFKTRFGRLPTPSEVEASTARAGQVAFRAVARESRDHWIRRLNEMLDPFLSGEEAMPGYAPPEEYVPPPAEEARKAQGRPRKREARKTKEERKEESKARAEEAYARARAKARGAEEAAKQGERFAILMAVANAAGAKAFYGVVWGRLNPGTRDGLRKEILSQWSTGPGSAYSVQVGVDQRGRPQTMLLDFGVKCSAYRKKGGLVFCDGDLQDTEPGSGRSGRVFAEMYEIAQGVRNVYRTTERETPVGEEIWNTTRAAVEGADDTSFRQRVQEESEETVLDPLREGTPAEQTALLIFEIHRGKAPLGPGMSFPKADLLAHPLPPGAFCPWCKKIARKMAAPGYTPQYVAQVVDSILLAVRKEAGQ